MSNGPPLSFISVHTIPFKITEMKVTKSNGKLLIRLSTSFKKHRFFLMILALTIEYFNELTSNSKAFGFSVEAKLFENRTNLLDARNSFSKYDDADFNEADYIDSYDTWVRHGANTTGYSSYISQMREMNDKFNKNETLGMSKEQREDVSSFLDLFNEYEDIKSDLQAKMDFMESESEFMINHPLLPKRGSDVAQNMEHTESPVPINVDVNITQWVPYPVPGSDTYQWIPFAMPDRSQSWNKSLLLDNIDPLKKYENRRMKFYSSKLQEYVVSLGKNVTQESYNSNLRYRLISHNQIHFLNFTFENTYILLLMKLYIIV